MNDNLEATLNAALEAVWQPGDAVWRDYLVPRLAGFFRSGLADKHFVSELQTANAEKLISRCWEALLHDRFRRLGWAMTSAADGPDFLLCDAAGAAQVEAVSLTAGDAASAEMDEAERLHRWAEAIRRKAGDFAKQVKEHRAARDRPFVIAINASGLCADPNMVGGLPMAFGAVFPIGPITHREARPTGGLVEAQHFAWRPTVASVAGITKDRAMFMSGQLSHVSAVLACSSLFPPIIGKRGNVEPDLPMVVVHNPNANHPLPVPWLPGAEEWAAELRLKPVRIGGCA